MHDTPSRHTSLDVLFFPLFLSIVFYTKFISVLEGRRIYQSPFKPRTNHFKLSIGNRAAVGSVTLECPVGELPERFKIQISVTPSPDFFTLRL